MADSEAPAPAESTRIWALLVSVAQYAHKDWPLVKGANNDTSRTSDFLRTQFEVPEENIVELTNEGATRKNIIGKFQSFLIDNPKIQRGDAIIFHFSGHGSRSPAPSGWPVEEEEEEDLAYGSDSGAQIEMIVPYDEGMIDPATGRPINGIPDRTLGALLTSVSKKFGNNITVVLDCCHSGHGTRGQDDEAAEFYAEYSSRGLDPSLVTALSADVDKDILSEAPPEIEESRAGGASRTGRRRAFRGASGRTHVLMAACAPHESALGNRQGGLLTTAWLAALRKPDIFPRTYTAILNEIARYFEMLRAKHPRFINQNPQCEGLGRERVVFTDHTLSKDFYPAEHYKELGIRSVKIEAGEVQGVRVGTLFELHELDKTLHPRRTLGSASAVQVHDTYTIAEVPEGLMFMEPKCVAVIIQSPYVLPFAVHNSAPGSSSAANSLKHVRESIDSTPPNIAHSLQELEYSEDVKAALIIEIEEDGGVTFHRRDPYLSVLDTPSPRIVPEDVPDASLPFILGGIAHFNRCLELVNQKKPFEADVSFELHLLDPASALESGFTDEQPLALGKEIHFMKPNDSPEAVPEVQIPDYSMDQYAFVLRNRTPTGLFPYVVYLDPATYAIETWYAPYEDKPSLRAIGENGTPGFLQLGGSAETPDPFEFSVPSWAVEGRTGERLDTSFIKVWLLTRTSKMDYVNQGGVLGFDLDGTNNVTKGGKHRGGMSTAQSRGGWDTLMRKITVRAI